VQPYTPAFLCGQAQRTASTRQYFYQHVNWKTAPISIDLGCGSGAITPELATTAPNSSVIGVDIDVPLLATAIQNAPTHPMIHFLLADAMALPLRSAIASFTLSHFTMMWIQNRNHAFKEVKRVLRRTGVFAAIEPDYTGRIEIPSPSIPSSKSSLFPIIHFLIKAGADPYTGSKLPLELAQYGFRIIDFGVLAWQFDALSIKTEIQGEAELLKAHGIQWTPPDYIYTPIWWLVGFKK
jgi:ubiquinone/menaquinone biosynthesis C-methylase UbiE